MRIAMLSPLHESVPPKQYGGTERIVSYLTESLVARGHEVTLFASGDSETDARLEAIVPQGLRLAKAVDPVAPHLMLLEKVFAKRAQFDLIHSHIDYLGFPLLRRDRHMPLLTTLHGRLDIPELPVVFREFKEASVISISNAQRKPLLWAEWAGTVYHGLPPTLYSLQNGRGKYLAFLGRVSPEKGLERAVRIAELAGIPLKVAAKVDKADLDYYKEKIAPLLRRSPWVEFIGEVNDQQKTSFLGDAKALLFPIDWPEPFGLVMIEAMACGTPVIAFRRGSVPEVMEDGVSGYIVESIEEAVNAVAKVDLISRQGCRRYFESRFTADRMAQDYERLYLARIERRAEALRLPEWQGRLHGRYRSTQGSNLRPGDVIAS